jgi:tape measure domain-containing protein
MSLKIAVESDTTRAKADIRNLFDDFGRLKSSAEKKIILGGVESRNFIESLKAARNQKVAINATLDLSSANSNISRFRADANKRTPVLFNASETVKQTMLAKNSMESFRASSNDTAADLSNTFASAANGIRSTMATIGSLLVTGLGLRSFMALSDEITKQSGLFSVLEFSAGKAARGFQVMADIAINTRSDLEAISDLYTKLSKGVGLFGTGREDVGRLTTTVAQSLALTRAPLATVNAALFQFNQGISSGVLRGEEMNSVLEGIPELAQAIAEGLGIPFKELRSKAAEGYFTTDKVLKGLSQGADIMEAKYRKMGVTYGGAFASMAASVKFFNGTIIRTFADEKGSVANFIWDMAKGLRDFSKRIPMLAWEIKTSLMNIFIDVLEVAEGVFDAIETRFNGISNVFSKSGLLSMVASAIAMFTSLRSALAAPFTFIMAGSTSILQSISGFVKSLNSPSAKPQFSADIPSPRVASAMPEYAATDFVEIAKTAFDKAALYIPQSIRDFASNTSSHLQKGVDAFTDGSGKFNEFITKAATKSWATLLTASSYVEDGFKKVMARIIWFFNSASVSLSRNETFRNVKNQVKSFTGLGPYLGEGPYKNAKDQPFGHNTLNLMDQETIPKVLLGVAGTLGLGIFGAFKMGWLREGPNLAIILGGAVAYAFGSLATNSVLPTVLRDFQWKVAAFSTDTIASTSRKIFGDVFGPGGLESVVTKLLFVALLFKSGREGIANGLLAMATAPSRFGAFLADRSALAVVNARFTRQTADTERMTGLLTNLRTNATETVRALARERISWQLPGQQRRVGPMGMEAAQQMAAGGNAPVGFRPIGGQATSTLIRQARLTSDRVTEFNRLNGEAMAENARHLAETASIRKRLQGAVDEARANFRTNMVSAGSSMGAAFGTIGGMQIGKDIADSMGDSPAWQKVGVVIGSSILGQAIGAGIGGQIAQVLGLALTSILSPIGLGLMAAAATIAIIMNWDAAKKIFLDQIVPALYKVWQWVLDTVIPAFWSFSLNLNASLLRLIAKLPFMNSKVMNAEANLLESRDKTDNIAREQVRTTNAEPEKLAKLDKEMKMAQMEKLRLQAELTRARATTRVPLDPVGINARDSAATLVGGKTTLEKLNDQIAVTEQLAESLIGPQTTAEEFKEVAKALRATTAAQRLAKRDLGDEDVIVKGIRAAKNFFHSFNQWMFQMPGTSAPQHQAAVPLPNSGTGAGSKVSDLIGSNMFSTNAQLMVDFGDLSDSEFESAKKIILTHEAELKRQFAGLEHTVQEKGGLFDSAKNAIYYADLSKVTKETIGVAYKTMLHEYGHATMAKDLGWVPGASSLDPRNQAFARRNDYEFNTGGELRNELGANTFAAKQMRIGSRGTDRVDQMDEWLNQASLSRYTKLGSHVVNSDKFATLDNTQVAADRLLETIVAGLGKDGKLDLKLGTIRFPDMTKHFGKNPTNYETGVDLPLEKVFGSNVANRLKSSKLFETRSSDSIGSMTARLGISGPQQITDDIFAMTSHLKTTVATVADDVKVASESNKTVIASIVNAATAVKEKVLTAINPIMSDKGINISKTINAQVEPIVREGKLTDLYLKFVAAVESSGKQVRFAGRGEAGIPIDVTKPHPNVRVGLVDDNGKPKWQKDAAGNITKDGSGKPTQEFSTAAGLWQITNRTWVDSLTELKMASDTVFSEANQRIVALHLMKKGGVQDLLDKGDFFGAMEKGQPIWEGIPSSKNPKPSNLSLGNVPTKLVELANDGLTKVGSTLRSAQEIITDIFQRGKSWTDITMEELQGIMKAGFGAAMEGFMKILGLAGDFASKFGQKSVSDLVEAIQAKFKGLTFEGQTIDIDKEAINRMGTQQRTQFDAAVDKLAKLIDIRDKSPFKEDTDDFGKFQQQMKEAFAAVVASIPKQQFSETAEPKQKSLREIVEAGKSDAEVLVDLNKRLKIMDRTLQEGDLEGFMKSIDDVDKALREYERLEKLGTNKEKLSGRLRAKQQFAALTQGQMAFDINSRDPIEKKPPSISADAAGAGKGLLEGIRGDLTSSISSALHPVNGTFMEKVTGRIVDLGINGLVNNLTGDSSIFGGITKALGATIYSWFNTQGGTPDEAAKGSVIASADALAAAFDRLKESIFGPADRAGMPTDSERSGMGRSERTGDDLSSLPAVGGQAQVNALPDIGASTEATSQFTGQGLRVSEQGFRDVRMGLQDVGSMVSLSKQGIVNALLSIGASSGKVGGFDLFGMLGRVVGGFSGADMAALSPLSVPVGTLAYASGGHISGPGTGTSDSILAALSNGEFVVNAQSTKRYAGLLHSINSGGLAKFAAGGLVGASIMASPNLAAATTALKASKPAAQSQSVFNINVTGDISRQTRAEIITMLPQIAGGVNNHNREIGYKTR